MPLMNEVVGKKIGPLFRDYQSKDVMLYALGIGAGFSDLEYCYEKYLKVIPTFGAAMIIDFFFLAAQAADVNLKGILHGEQELIFHHPFPLEGSLITQGSISRIYDKGEGKGALVITESDTFHSNDKKLFTSIMTLFARLDGGFGGENTPKNTIAIPDRRPDAVIKASPSENQPLIYRLSGDLFALHADPEFARSSGFERPIMHGLCTEGFACRALIQNFIPKEPEKVKRIACRFSKPLYPGIPIQTQIWQTETGKALWRVINQETQETVIDKGIFEFQV